jgi:hypothetical protein
MGRKTGDFPVSEPIEIDGVTYQLAQVGSVVLKPQCIENGQMWIVNGQLYEIDATLHLAAKCGMLPFAINTLLTNEQHLFAGWTLGTVGQMNETFRMARSRWDLMKKATVSLRDSLTLFTSELDLYATLKLLALGAAAREQEAYKQQKAARDRYYARFHQHCA